MCLFFVALFCFSVVVFLAVLGFVFGRILEA